jgi:ketosteroid isomerase-like protein
MRTLMMALMVFSCASGWIAEGQSNDVEAVKAAYAEHVARVGRGDVDLFLQQHLPGHTAFGPGGTKLSRWDSIAEEKKARPDLAKPQNPPNRLHHLEAQVYGGDAAVVTAYSSAPVTLTDGTTRPGIRRITSVWIKQNGNWVEVHDHMSTLMSGKVPATEAP